MKEKFLFSSSVGNLWRPANRKNGIKIQISNTATELKYKGWAKFSGITFHFCFQ